MCRIYCALASRLRSATRQPDRGEFGPMAYAVMVSAMVLLALAVAVWGERIANEFMGQIEGPGGAG
jgi:hypothetical protein